MLPGRFAMAAVAAFLVLVPSASAKDFATTALNVLPSGQYGVPGNPDAPKQAELYNSLTPRFDNVTDADLPSFFKSEALEPTTVVSTETIPARPGVQIKRDDFNVPHVYGQTDDDVVFGAGWVAAADRGLLLAQARYNGLTAAIDAPNLSAINLISGLYNFTPSDQTNKIVAEQTDEILKQGPRGKQLLDDIDTYLEGINAWYAANAPSTAKFTRNDIYAINAVKAQFLGQGGGDEVDSSMFLNGLQKRLGAVKGLDTWSDLRNRKDPEAPVTVSKPAPYDTATGSRGGTVTLQNGSFKAEGGLPPSSGRAASTDRTEASNILMVSGGRSATGKPLFVGGPQISYFFPGLVYEIGLHGPDIDVRGATSAPFPGYLLIGRGEDFAWTLTSAGGDIIDTWAETLCGGSKLKYLYKGKCLNMEKVSAGTLTKGTLKQDVTFYRTVHGSVTGYAKTAAGKTVAIARQRSSYGKDTVDQLFFQQLTFGRVKSFKDFTAAAALTPQTFNSFYADEKTTGVYTSGLFPLRRTGSDGSLVNDGRGAFEWRGFLPANRHPQGEVTNGTLISWNNRPAPGFVAGDDRFGDEGPLQRVDMLNGEVARTPKHTLGSVVSSMNVAAVGDVRGYSFWPTMKAMLAKGKPPSARAKTMVDLLSKWNKNRAPRLDKDRDSKLDDPGVPIMDGIWDGVANAALCGPLGKALCNQLDDTLHGRFSAPPGGQYGGWYHYMSKDFRTLLGQKPKGAFSRTYCAATAAACAAKLWKAIDAAGAKLAAKLGPDPATWRSPRLEVSFIPLELIKIDYTNRPSGIQQVISFTGHR